MLGDGREKTESQSVGAAGARRPRCMTVPSYAHGVCVLSSLALNSRGFLNREDSGLFNPHNPLPRPARVPATGHRTQATGNAHQGPELEARHVVIGGPNQLRTPQTSAGVSGVHRAGRSRRESWQPQAGFLSSHRLVLLPRPEEVRLPGSPQHPPPFQRRRPDLLGGTRHHTCQVSPEPRHCLVGDRTHHRHDVGAQERPGPFSRSGPGSRRGAIAERPWLEVAAGERRLAWLAEAGHLQEAGRGCTEVLCPRAPTPFPCPWSLNSSPAPLPLQGRVVAACWWESAGGRPPQPPPLRPTRVSLGFGRGAGTAKASQGAQW